MDHKRIEDFALSLHDDGGRLDVSVVGAGVCYGAGGERESERKR